MKDHGGNAPTVAICLTCKNASATIEYTLRSVASLNYPKDKLIIIIVDGGSSDNTVDIARRLLSSYGLKHEIVIKPCNIPEGRNICIDRALKIGADYIFFVDSDVIVADKNILAKLIIFDKRHGPCIVHANVKNKVFSSLGELRLFSSRIAELNEGSNDVMLARAVPCCAMGLTLIPIAIARRVRFDEDMTFNEDCSYGYSAWKSGYKVYLANTNSPIAYDVNLPKHSDIYARMSVRDYLRGLRKKVLMRAYTYYDGSVLKTMTKFLKDVAGKRMLLHFLITLMLTMGLIMLSMESLQYLGLAFIALYMVVDLPYLVRLRKARCESLRQVSDIQFLRVTIDALNYVEVWRAT